MRDNRPGRLRELTKDPVRLLEVLTDAIQGAHRVGYEAEQKGAKPWQAREMELAVLCPVDTQPADSELPMTDREWEQALQALEAAPEEL